MSSGNTGPKRSMSCGSCQVDHFSPPVANFGPTTQKLKIYFSFAEASRLVLAMQERLRDIHKFKRNSQEAKKAAVNLVITLPVNNVAVMPGKLTQIEN